MACPRQTVGAHLKATGPDDAARANHRRWPCFGRACAATSFWGFASGGNTPSVAPLWTSTAERLALLSSWTARHTAVGWTWMHNAINSCWTTASACCDWKTTTSCSTSTARWLALRRRCRPVDVIARPADTPLRLRRGDGGEVFRRCRKAQSASRSWYRETRRHPSPLAVACGEGPGVRFSAACGERRGKEGTHWRVFSKAERDVTNDETALDGRADVETRCSATSPTASARPRARVSRRCRA